MTTVAGVDEAGRGPLAGPVAVAAVILDASHDWSNVDDSKKLEPEVRATLAEEIRAHSVWSVIFVSSSEVDRMNILAATMFGMQQAVRGLGDAPDRVLIDGNRCPDLPMPAEAMIGGDAREKCIGAASILAKQARDEYMIELHERLPEYGFDRHKGYGTPEHLAALRRFGPTPEHRRSFAPVRDCLQGDLF
ncbi:MAG: ribonuclease HII [Pseudomonadota bacterium]